MIYQKEIDPNKSIFPINVDAEILEVNPRTLRVYEERKLIEPSRNVGNWRLYSLNDINLLEYVRYLIQIRRMNAAGVREIFSILNTIPGENRDLIIASVRNIKKLPKDKLELYKEGSDEVPE